MVQYAVKRTKDHIERFLRLYDEILSGNINEEFLRSLEEKDNIFPDLDYRVYATAGGYGRPVEAIALAQ